MTTPFRLRVIAGALKGRRLKAPSWDGLRPTSDKVRETLFNVLMPRIEGARVLDGCAGTGALGIEALSRGAAHVTFIDDDHRAAQLIEENLALCQVREGYAIIRAVVVRGVDSLRRRPGFVPFDIILLDPPYSQQPDEVVAIVQDVVAPRGVIVIEHARRQRPAESIGSLTRIRQIVSGDSTLSFYEPSNQ